MLPKYRYNSKNFLIHQNDNHFLPEDGNINQQNFYPTSLRNNSTQNKAITYSSYLENPLKSNTRNQKLFVVRHGERVDSYYGQYWIQNSFTLNGQYIKSHVNMPEKLIQRDNPFDFEIDPPLTQNGLEQARLHGEELARAGVEISHMYSSPALRSIQTADKILEGMGLKNQIPIRIEIGLFEPLSWQKFIPSNYPFLDPAILKANGYNIDLSYKSLVTYEQLKRDESINDFYLRSYYVTKFFVEYHSFDGGSMMLVAHAPSLEGCTRLLTEETLRTDQEFADITKKVTFLSIAQCEKNELNGKWKLTPLLSFWEKEQKKYLDNLKPLDLQQSLIRSIIVG